MRKIVAYLAFLAFIEMSSSSAFSQGRVDPEVRKRLDREFAAAHPQPGDYLPAIALLELDDKKAAAYKIEPEQLTAMLRYAATGDVKLVVTASLTCPKTRQHFPALQQIKEKYGDRLGVIVVYVVEAHPERDVCPYLGVVDITEANLRDNIRFRQPTTMEARVQMAKGFAKRYPITGDFLVDSMENIAWRSLGKSPNMALLADAQGRVVFRQGWVAPESLDVEIEKLLKSIPIVSGGMLGGRRATRPKADKDLLPGEATMSQDSSLSYDELQTSESKRSKVVTEILKRLSPDSPFEWNFVRWLEDVNDDKLRLLLKRYPTVINEQLTYGAHGHLKTSVLQLMIARADLTKVKIAVEANADVNLEIGDETPLSAAIRTGKLEIVDYLVKAGANVHQTRKRTKKNYVLDALLQRKPEIAQRLVKAGVPLDIFSRCGLGMIEEVAKQLDDDPSCGLLFDEDGNIPLSFAVANNQSAMVQLLIDRQMVCDAGKPDSKSPVQMAIGNTDTTILQMLLKHGLSPDSHWGGPLLDALHENNYEHFSCLMSANASLEASGSSRVRGMNPLHLSIDRELPVKFAKDLLDRGVDVNALTTGYDDDGCGPSDPQSTQETALHLAARFFLPEHATLLLSRGAKPDELDQAGLSPLAAAILRTCSAKPEDTERGLATIKALVEGGCSVDAVDSNSNEIRDTIEKLLKKPPTKAPKSESQWLQPFEVKAKKYRGPVGFDATQLSPTPVLYKIQELLQAK